MILVKHPRNFTNNVFTKRKFFIEESMKTQIFDPEDWVVSYHVNRELVMSKLDTSR